MSPSSSFRLLPEDHDLGWTPYAWLIYLPVVFVEPVLHGASAVRWLVHAAVVLVFLASYFGAHWVRGRALLPFVLVQCALGVAFSPINTGAYVFFIYAAAFAARADDARNALAGIGAVVVAGVVTAFSIHAPIYYWVGHVIFTPLIGGVNVHRTQVGRATAKLRAAHDEIERLAAVAERERIARDLHDVLGHTLSLIVLKAELASKLADRDPQRAAREIRDVEAVSRQALAEVREAIRGYRPTFAEELTRARALLDSARIGATIETTIDRDELVARRGAEEAMALALREAVTNVVRHSGASRTTIRAWRRPDEGSAVLEVVDDGRGADRVEGAGLRGMRERIAAVNGQVTKRSHGGTRLTITIPLSPTAARAIA
jgi:two-component system sensor histidine kinase DesK